jgi:pimeloyl-ACP methyl ester carboxylesterase
MYTLKDFGSYTVGGRRIEIRDQAIREIQFTRNTRYLYDPNGTFPVEHAYVQFYLPAEHNRQPPVVLLHGGGLSGSMWETTCDGRPGWLHGLLSRGYEVHVLDNVERGRAGWRLDLWDGGPVFRSMDEAWTLFRFGRAEDFAARKPYTGQRFPVDHLEAFARTFSPRWTSTSELQIQALLAVLQRTGPAIVICHSQGGQIAFEAAARAPQQVARLIACEPSGFSENLQSLQSIPVKLMFGDYLDCDKIWTGLVQRCRDFQIAMHNLSGAKKIELMMLNDEGAPHHSHMMMMDRENMRVLELALR